MITHKNLFQLEFFFIKSWKKGLLDHLKLLLHLKKKNVASRQKFAKLNGLLLFVAKQIKNISGLIKQYAVLTKNNYDFLAKLKALTL